jgi:anti-sigma factor RsiW
MPKKKVTTEMLIAYAAGELDADATARVQAVIADSPADAARLARIRATLATMRGDDSVAPSREALILAKAIFRHGQDARRTHWWQRLEQVVATLVHDSRAQPALAGYRGVGDAVQLSYESELADIDLELSPSGTQEHAAWTVMGQVSARPPAAIVSVVLVSRSQGGAQIEIEPDEHGLFTLRADAEEYDLFIRIADKVIALPDLNLT